MDELQACSTCRYFIPGQRVSVEPHDGTCHILPPANYTTNQAQPPPEQTDDGTTLMTFVDGSYTGWPIVRASDWCGEWDGGEGDDDADA